MSHCVAFPHLASNLVQAGEPGERGRIASGIPLLHGLQQQVDDALSV
jgi:hypothetical protein